MWVKDKAGPLVTLSGVEIASGYTRIVEGDRGCYIEFSFNQLNPCCLNPEAQVNHYYYTEHRTTDGVMIYHQKLKVSYADYLPKMWYVSLGSLKGFSYGN